MEEKTRTAITPTRREDYPAWYQQVIKAADLAENSAVRGCMVIKPWGYSIWENMQAVLDGMFKDTGHVNAYFPLLIPKSFLEKEAAHIEGFAKECAVVTHHRLKADGKGGLVPDGELDEPYVIRPTSETIIGDSYAKWVQSYRDLPILVNQWANVMRWEMRTRMFLRTTEFLWQEGHTVHETAEDAMEETLKMLDVYERFARDFMALPVFKGEKTAEERFPGAVNTYSIEAMMQDGKALQAGTSHFLGQNFAKASGIQFLNRAGDRVHAWTTSWGVSTRLIGALIMAHSDDDGLVLPPLLAPEHVQIFPIYRNDDEKAQVLAYCQALRTELRDLRLGERKLQVSIDDRDIRGGEKVWQAIKKGVPARIEIGPRDIAADSLMVGFRDLAAKDKQKMSRQQVVGSMVSRLEAMQKGLLDKATTFRDGKMKAISSLTEFTEFFKGEGGFAVCHWDGGKEAFAKLEPLAVTARCKPFALPAENGTCIFSGRKTEQRIIFAKSY